MYYTGRDMKTTHKGMKISESDWSIFLEHAGATMKALQVPQQECDDVVVFVLGLKKDIVEAQINACNVGAFQIDRRIFYLSHSRTNFATELL